MHAPAPQRDLFVWLQGREDATNCFARALQWRDALAGVAEVVHEEHGFRFRDSRDLTGFVDGSANPRDDARMAAALVDGGEYAGGSFVFTQNAGCTTSEASRRLPVADQERVIGRTKPDSIELEGDAMPPDSHVSRTDIKRDGQAVKIYRRSSPVGGIRDAGLYFLAFSADVSTAFAGCSTRCSAAAATGCATGCSAGRDRSRAASSTLLAGRLVGGVQETSVGPGRRWQGVGSGSYGRT